MLINSSNRLHFTQLNMQDGRAVDVASSEQADWLPVSVIHLLSL